MNQGPKERALRKRQPNLLQIIGICLAVLIVVVVVWMGASAISHLVRSAASNPPVTGAQMAANNNSANNIEQQVVAPPVEAPAQEIPLAPAVATVEPLGNDPRHNIEIAAEQIHSGDELLPFRGDKTVVTHVITNTDDKEGILNVSLDPGSTLILKGTDGLVITQVYDSQGMGVILPFTKGQSVQISTTWNEDNETWNVWAEFYVPRDGYTYEDFKWSNILYWDITQGKPHFYWLDSTNKFVDLGKDPVRPK